MLRAKVNGLSVAYERTGDGPALVLLHGFAVDSRMWRPQIESLSDKFTVIAWDAPGAGQSSDPPETFGIGEWADCLAGILDATGFNWHTSLVFLGEGSSPRSSIGAIPRLCCRLSWQIHTLVGKVHSRTNR